MLYAILIVGGGGIKCGAEDKMLGKNRFFLTLAVVLGVAAPLSAQPNNDLRQENSRGCALIDTSVANYLRNERYNSDTPQKKGFSIIQLFKSKAFAATENIDERQRLREEWREFLGLDVFYPYFKAHDVEEYIREKSAVKLFNLRGKAEFNRNSKEVRYIFRNKF